SALFPATESQGIFPSPAWLKVRGCKSRGVTHWATLVLATRGWEICGHGKSQRDEGMGESEGGR
ncbi:MAG: hypothetical protein QHJ82_13585, partial [Verrucomicrobiota bacterium]|nr:hypothetical protein [Verrucomicrobiota bacterium]